MNDTSLNFHGKVVVQALKKDNYTGLLLTDGRLETYMNRDLVWTSYAVSADYAETEFIEAIGTVTGEMYI